MTLINGDTVAGQDRCAAIWGRSPDRTSSRHGMTAQDCQQASGSLGKQGFCLSQISGYSVGSQDRYAYAAIWEHEPCPAFVAGHGMTPDQYQKAFDQLTRDGFRLSWVDADRAAPSLR